MLILSEYSLTGKRIIFFITERIRNEVHYEMASMYTKSVFYVQDLLTGGRKGLYTKDLYELMATDKEYLQLDKYHFYKL